MPDSRAPLRVLFVHGMGRSPLSGWPMLRRLRQAGLQTTTFGYMTSRETFAEVAARLAARIGALSAQASRQDLVLVGHSLGGVLLRAALAIAADPDSPPRHLFLLGSPVQASRLAQLLRSNPVFRALTRDCGELLGSQPRMAAIAPAGIPCTAIIGTRGITGRGSPFGEAPNDGVVAVSEASADWLAERIFVPVIHTLLPSSSQVAAIIVDRLGRQ